MKKITKQTKLIEFILLLLIFLIGNTSPALFQSEEIKNPGKAIIEVENLRNLSKVLDPAVAYDTGYSEFIDLAYEGLVKENLNIKNDFIGDLAESWTKSANGTIYSFKLKENIFYHDGTPFNAYTMKYSIDREMIMNTGPSLLIQEHILGGPELMAVSDLNVTQANIYLSAQNSVDEIEYINTDSETRNLHIRSGESDILIYPSKFEDYINFAKKSIVEGLVAYNKFPFITRRYIFNFNDSLTKYVIPAVDIDTTWNQTHIQNEKLVRYSNNETFLASIENPFTSLLFRKAFSHVFDYDSFISESFYQILANRSEGIIPKGMIGHQDQLIEKNIIPSFDLQRAESLFKKVGWRGNITINKLVNNTYHKPFNDIIKSSMDYLDVGINIDIKEVNFTDFQSNFWIQPFISEGFSADYADPDHFIRVFLYSSGPFAFSTKYKNPELDQLIDQAKYELDFNIRMDLYKQIEELAAHDYSGIYVAQSSSLIIARDWLYDVEESGSLNPMANGFKWQYISKGKPVETSTDSSVITSTYSTSIELMSMFLVLPIMVYWRKLRK
jgi:ABC-type transport system substrate-binding protein